MKAPHHRGAHHRLSAIVRAAYNADPRTVCARCGLTRAQGVDAYGAKGAKWEAGHRIDGVPARTTADYQPEHAHCNHSAGGRLGNRRRKAKRYKPSRNW